LAAEARAPRAVTLAPPLVAATLAATHVIVADVALVTPTRGTLALVSARRPDELDGAEIDARDVSETAEALAGLLAGPYFGAAGWTITRQPAPGAMARLVEGAAALMALAEAEAALTAAVRREVEAGVEGEAVAAEGAHVVDLARAWFVLTGLPWVSAVLLAGRTAAIEQADELAAVVAALRESARLGREREAVVVAEASARLEQPARDIRQAFRAWRYELGDAERTSLATFFQRAARQARLPAPPEVTIVQAGAMR
jgi:predicted solute-binding protein